jgi:hypothetical protein
MRKSRFGAMVLFSMICHGAHAERLAPGSLLSGYQCYNLNTDVLKLTPDDLWAGKGLPPVFKRPSEDSGNLGAASGPVYVAWPLQKENGFVRTLRFGGELGWISEAVIRPLYRDPRSKGGCTLAWHGNLIQYHLDPGAKAWVFRDGHDIPEDKFLERSSHPQ